jgi:diadenosine tetraphosphate (Ap4A) HIT family hydrolase
MLPDPKAFEWRLDPLLQRDTVPVGDLPLSRVLLINDANYPWLLLVPRRVGTSEITDLEYVEQAQLMTEIAAAGRVMKEMTGCDKINTAALGNVVAQLHVHIIARKRGDAAWPKPVWGVVPAVAYIDTQLQDLIPQLQEKLTLKGI